MLILMHTHPVCIFFLYSSNPRVPCHSLPYLDLSHWREKVTQCRVNGLDIELGSSKKISPCTSCTCTKEGVIFKATSYWLVQIMWLHIKFEEIWIQFYKSFTRNDGGKKKIIWRDQGLNLWPFDWISTISEHGKQWF